MGQIFSSAAQRPNNQYTAEQTLGRAHMEAARNRAPAERKAMETRREIQSDARRALTGLGFSYPTRVPTRFCSRQA
jgi:hypothetical protein